MDIIVPLNYQTPFFIRTATDNEVAKIGHVNRLIEDANAMRQDDASLQGQITSLQAQVTALASPYKVYTALLTQSSTNAPTAVVLQNTLGVVPTFSYGAVGQYSLNSTNLFPDINKVFIITADWGRQPIKFFWNSVSQIAIRSSVLTAGAFAFSDDILSSTPLEIRIYS